MIALRSSPAETNEFTERQKQIVYSFTYAWLTSQKKKLGQVVATAIQLPPSIHYLSRVGMLDRTTENVVSGATFAAGVVGSYLVLDGIWDLLPTEDLALSPWEVVAADTAISVLPTAIFGRIESQLGAFGTPIARKDFDSEIVIGFLQLCYLRDKLFGEGAPPVKAALLPILDQRIFTLFLLGSRLVEGLVLSGQSEALAAASAQSAITLGLHQLSSRSEIIRMLERSTEAIDDRSIKKSVEVALDALKESMAVETSQVKRELDRLLVSSMASEASDLAAEPVKLTLGLIASMTGVLKHVAPTPTSAKLIDAAQLSLKKSVDLIDATPDAISTVLQRVIASESWLKSLFRSPISSSSARATEKK